MYISNEDHENQLIPSQSIGSDMDSRGLFFLLQTCLKSHSSIALLQVIQLCGYLLGKVQLRL